VKILVWIRSLWAGWLTLAAIAYLVERPVLGWLAPHLGPMWVPTAHLAFDCVAMTAAGFEAGRFNRSHPMWSAGLLAATLCCYDFRGLVALNVPWLMQLIWKTFQDFGYFDSLLTSVETHAFLFGCLIAGAMLSRPREKPISIAD
jgi:hypothetical protein